MNKKAKKFDYVLAVIFVFLVIVIRKRRQQGRP